MRPTAIYPVLRAFPIWDGEDGAEDGLRMELEKRTHCVCCVFVYRVLIRFTLRSVSRGAEKMQAMKIKRVLLALVRMVWLDKQGRNSNVGKVSYLWVL